MFPVKVIINWLFAGTLVSASSTISVTSTSFVSNVTSNTGFPTNTKSASALTFTVNVFPSKSFTDFDPANASNNSCKSLAFDIKFSAVTVTFAPAALIVTDWIPSLFKNSSTTVTNPRPFKSSNESIVVSKIPTVAAFPVNDTSTLSFVGTLVNVSSTNSVAFNSFTSNVTV